MREHILCLPVSRLEVRLREPAGVEDMLLLDAKIFDTHLAVSLLAKIATTPEGSEVDWFALSLTDLDTALLLTRRMLLGERIRADAICPSEGCGTPIEVSFYIRDYLAHHTPRQPRGVQPAAESGWLQFKGSAISFRLPTVADQIEIARHPHPKQALMQRCIRPPDLKARQVGVRNLPCGPLHRFRVSLFWEQHSFSSLFS